MLLFDASCGESVALADPQTGRIVDFVFRCVAASLRKVQTGLSTKEEFSRVKTTSKPTATKRATKTPTRKPRTSTPRVVVPRAVAPRVVETQHEETPTPNPRPWQREWDEADLDTVEGMCREIKKMSLKVQLQAIEMITAELRSAVADDGTIKRKPSRIMELEGIGQGIYGDVDAYCEWVRHGATDEPFDFGEDSDR